MRFLEKNEVIEQNEVVMGKLIKSKMLKSGQRVFLMRYLRNGKFVFTIDVIDYDLNEHEELEYTVESVFEQYDLMVLEYDFSKVA